MSTQEQEYFLKLANRFEEATVVKKGLVIESIEMDGHSRKRARERFSLSDKDSLDYFKNTLSKSTYICETVGIGGARSHLYGYKPKDSHEVTAIHVSMDYKTITTVYKETLTDYFIPKHLKEKLTNVTRTEVRMWTKKENSCLKKIDYVVAEAKAEIYTLKFELLKTTSQKKRDNYSNRIIELQNHIDYKYDEIKKIQEKVRSSARTLLLFL